MVAVMGSQVRTSRGQTSTTLRPERTPKSLADPSGIPDNGNGKRHASLITATAPRPLLESRALKVLHPYCGLKRRADRSEWFEKLITADPALRAVSEVHITVVDTLFQSGPRRAKRASFK